MIVQENLKIPPFLMTRGFDPCTPRFEVWCFTNCATWACELVMSLSSYSALISTDSYRILHTVIQQFPTQFPTVPNSSQQLEHDGREGTLHLASNGLCVSDRWVRHRTLVIGKSFLVLIEIIVYICLLVATKFVWRGVMGKLLWNYAYLRITHYAYGHAHISPNYFLREEPYVNSLNPKGQYQKIFIFYFRIFRRIHRTCKIHSTSA